MKLLHIADLHIGKRVGALSMIPEQLNVIDQLARMAADEQVSGVLVAGDVFDRPVPSREALETCEAFFSAFVDQGIPVFAIPGNHDAPQQLAFCSALLAPSGLHIARAFDGSLDRFVLEEDGERVCIHLLPFVRPTDVRMALPEAADGIVSHEDAVRAALETDELDDDAVNVLVAHQFVTAGPHEPDTCDSETASVGGADNVDASVFDAYDYVALGHLHGAQHVGRPTLRYGGSPLKYSFSEAGHEKSATIITIDRGEVAIDTRALEPLHDMREVVSSYEDLVEGADEGDHLDYMHVTLTDASLPDAMAKLRVIYPNILRLDWSGFESGRELAELKVADMEALSPLDLFDEYYRKQTGRELGEAQRSAVESCMGELSA